jgi:hypothetical protein
MNHRAVLALLLVVAFLALFASLAWAAVRFATPQPEYVEIGGLSDFPPSAEPYFVNDPRPVYILNYNDVLLVLDPLNRVQGGYQVHWFSEGQAYIDPSRGTWFDRYGSPIHNPNNIDYPVEKNGLFRYPVSIRGGRIIIEVSRPVNNTP